MGIPALSMVGLVDEILADRAFVEQRHHSAAELATIADVQGEAPSIAPHYLANALAAAALARAYGVGPLSVRDGLRAVSYTHLDVYKRQRLRCGCVCTGVTTSATP